MKHQTCRGSVALQGLRAEEETQSRPMLHRQDCSGGGRENRPNCPVCAHSHSAVVTGVKNSCTNVYLEFSNQPNFPLSWAVCCVVQDLTVS